jgi:catechol 2,3-dioxygenase-like lactoylglutathione lyase family enzyme
MKRVTGIGGIFIKSANLPVMREWYQKHLGIDIGEWGGAAFKWKSAENPDGEGTTAWSLFEASSNYFDPSKAAFMVNYRVHQLAPLLAALRAEGCNVVEKTDESEFGKFGWVFDPDGNKIELWEPPPGG